MARRSFLVALLGAVVMAVGCGGPMEPQELARSVQTLESSAAEGALLGERGGTRPNQDHVRAGRTRATWATTVDHEAEKLADADANGDGRRAQGAGRRPRADASRTRSASSRSRPAVETGAGRRASARWTASPKRDAEML